MPGKYHDIATRAQALTLKVVKCPDAENTKIIGLPRSTINSIYRTARARGYNPDACQTILIRTLKTPLSLEHPTKLRQR